MPDTPLSRWLDAWLPKPKPRSRSKPREMLYTVDETPPLGISLTLGLQHALLALMLSVYAVIAAHSVGLHGQAVQDFVATCILVAAVGTLLQSSQSRFGAGHLVVHIPTPITLGTFIAVGSTLGVEAAAGGMLVAGVFVLLMSRGLSRLRSVLPPEVTGVAVTMLGLSMVQGGVERSLGLTEIAPTPQADASLVAGITLAAIVILSIWGGKRWRNYAVLIGVALGYGISMMFGPGDLPTAESDAATALFSLPLGEIPVPTLMLMAAVPFVLAEVVNAVDSFGNLLTLDKMNDADWRRSDIPMVSRGIFAQGLTVLLSGLTGTLSTGPSSANVGLAFATGVSARRVAQFAGLFLLVAAFLPHISAVIAETPRPVVGAILIYASGYLIVAGMELILSRLLNARRVFVVGFAIVTGMAVIVIPALPESAPAWAQPLLASSLAVATLVALVLNLLFRIGVTQRTDFTLPEVDPVPATQEFIENQGAAWGARAATIGRATHSIGEAIELIEPQREPGSAPPRLQATFDEFFLEFTLFYQGPALPISAEADKQDLVALFENGDDKALDSALDDLPLIMLKRLADRISAGSRDGSAYLRLVFEH